MRKVLSFVALVYCLSMGVSLKEARADWGDLFCDIYSNGDLKSAVNFYNNPEEEDRGCLDSIRFFAPMVISLNEPLIIDQYPGSGFSYGGRFRKCIHGSEAGCPSMSNTAVVLDFSGYTANGGKCPIRVANGAKFAFANFKLKVKNKDLAICRKESEVAIPVDDPENPYAWIHNVEVEGSGGPPYIPVDPPYWPIGCVGDFDCDKDNDGVKNWDDNCPDSGSNPDQTDTDKDGKGNICDDDDDGDGVKDNDDDCSNTPLGTNVEKTGCPDQDDDDVKDTQDDCPNTPPNTPVDSKGCPLVNNDQDGDGEPDATDYCDLGSTGNACDSSNLAACFVDQNDNICQGCSETEDLDSDGLGDRCDPDIDGDGISNGSNDPNPFDPDPDTDGVCDGSVAVTINKPYLKRSCVAGPDQCPLNNQKTQAPCNPTPPPPSSTDTDGDGLTDELELFLGTNPNLKDTDGDGATDGVDCSPNDSSKKSCGTTTILIDPDFDNDGICDSATSAVDPITNQPCTPNTSKTGDNCPATHNPDQKDGNGNGVGDACELSPSLNENDGDGDGLDDDMETNVFHTDNTNPDTDGDGLLDGEEVNGPTYLGGFGPNNPDVDGDKICDGPNTVVETPETCPDGKKDDEEGCDTSKFAEEVCKAGPDNCPLVDNPNQENGNTDPLGDACEGNMDGDLKLDNDDNCIFVANDDQGDFDKDGLGDACDLTLGLAENLGPEGCGCRIDAQSPRGGGGLIPFLAMMLPLALFKIVRRRVAFNDSNQ